ncbi:hypothetical protein DFH07DRAFT_747279 [Mycena maculata]|uniref:Gfd2/YDR514C-like C-terminal domain-containing protein n=1 Tax=Mycena maculata TaxID=230809 RepID=A0AAD7IQM4_9AGAR|nr:hypothetical protein DFH07DRAFT_747279 [Mycena maculata]
MFQGISGHLETKAETRRLGADALIHPQNPIHVEGVDGIYTFLGMFHNGESRYFFSSAQIDYIRYWLNAMNLTSDIIPLPHSDCFVPKEELSTVAPAVHPDKKTLRKAVDKVKKVSNRLVQGVNVSLLARRTAFERVRKFWTTKVGAWCALDFEEWTGDHRVVTEFGYSLLHWKDGVEVKDFKHFTVWEARAMRNGQYVPENREHYNFGTSEEIKKAKLKAKIATLLSELRGHGPIFLVFHDPRGDLETLQRLEAPISGAVSELPDSIPSEGLFIVDTAALFAALMGEGQRTFKLQQVCNQLGIETEWLHNAGNDAFYTLLALREMAEGGPLDTQKEARWPTRKGMETALTVQLLEERPGLSSDEEDDMIGGGYSTTTGILKQ